MKQINLHPVIRFFQNNGIAILVILAFIFLICRFPYQFEKPKPQNKLIEAVEAQTQKRITKADTLNAFANSKIKKSNKNKSNIINSKKIENEAISKIPSDYDSIFSRVRAFSNMSNDDIRKIFYNSRTSEHKQTAN